MMGKESKDSRTGFWTLIPSSWRTQIKYSDVELVSSDIRKEERSTSSLSSLTNILPLPKTLSQNTYEEGREWIKGALLCTYGAGTILAINIILSIIATTIGLSNFGGSFQAINVYQGSCSMTGNWATGLHALINVLSTLLFAASNYVMQCLGAPSRADVNRAHRERKWLDIGTFSLRNLSILNKKQRILWGLLLVTSTPIHMVYNSVVYSTISALDYAVLLIPDNLAADQPLAAADNNFESNFFEAVGTSATDIQAEIFNGTYKHVTAQECLDTYNTTFNTELDTLIAVTDPQFFHNTTVLKGKVDSPSENMGTPFAVSSLYGWIRHFEQKYKKPANQQDFIVQGVRFEYPSWELTAPNPAMPLPEASFNLKNGWENGWADGWEMEGKLGVGVTRSDSQRWKQDLGSLCDYVILDNPDREALQKYLTTPENWINSSWAANVKFKQEKGPIYPDQVGMNVGGLPLVPLPETPVWRCMIKHKEPLCQLTFSPAIAVIVIVSNMIKVVCMYLTAKTSRTHLFLTVGDAISSFLEKPDGNTEDQRNTMHGADDWRAPFPIPGLGRYEAHIYSPVYYTTLKRVNDPFWGAEFSATAEESLPKTRKRWYRAVSTTRLTMAITFFIFSELLSVVFCSSAFALVHSLSAAWDLGFGKFNGKNKIFSPGISEDTLSLVLLSNTPQLALSILYFLCNGILTSMLAAAEYNDYAVRRRPLRVSWPKGQQRSTYYLSLPYRYSVPLISVAAALHWLLSQSIFFVNIIAYDVHNKPVAEEGVRGCGYSPFPMFIILLISGILLVIFCVLCTRRFQSPMPLAAQKSASISAACHPPPDDYDAPLKPVMWGQRLQDECDADISSASSEPSRPSRSEPSHTYYTFTSKEVAAEMHK